jgi:LPXTG-site transpeptidase (sortase) family protein
MLFLGVLLVVLLAIVAWGVFDYVRATTGDDVPSADIVTTVNPQPSEYKPVVDNRYTVPASQPRVIAIQKIGVNAYIQRVGIDSLGAIATPNNIHVAGWYLDSKTPGETGVSIIDGHVGGRYNPGVFEHLAKLTSGDAISVQFGDLSWKEFAVESVATYKQEETSKPLFAETGKSPTLRLITCGGSYDNKSETYSHRTIVTAVLR